MDAASQSPNEHIRRLGLNATITATLAKGSTQLPVAQYLIKQTDPQVVLTAVKAHRSGADAVAAIESAEFIVAEGHYRVVDVTLDAGRHPPHPVPGGAKDAATQTTAADADIAPTRTPRVPRGDLPSLHAEATKHAYVDSPAYDSLD